MAINKVVYGNDTLVDLTEDSVTANTLLEGETAHNAAGEQITGTAKQGHVVKDASGTAMTQRANLQFVDAHLTDDSGNDRTEVEIAKEVTEAAFDALNPQGTEYDGAYLMEVAGATPLTADMVGYNEGTVKGALDDLNRGSVSVTADGVKTYSELLDELYNSIDNTKIRLSSSVVTIDGFVFPAVVYADSMFLTYSRPYGLSNYIYVDVVSLTTIGSAYTVYKSNNTSESKSSQVPTNGTVITLYY